MDAIVKQPLDKINRPLRDLRISVTDRCNFRCIYCMPKTLFGPDHAFLQRSQILSFEEIQRTIRIFASLGVKKIRITGGEPLIRKDLEKLIEKISHIPSIDDISLTTNGALLSKSKADSLAGAGLNRVTLSLDALENESFKKINDVNFSVEKVLQAVDIAKQANLGPVKVNMVVINPVNVDQIIPMVDYFRNRDVILRFIEFMDVGSTNKWQYDKVFSAASIIELINQHYPIQPVVANYRGEVAKRWQFKDGGGEIGIIASVTQPFCGGCHRARLSAEGKLYTCLFASTGYDLRNQLRTQSDDAIVLEKISSLWRQRDDQYSQLRDANAKSNQKIEMSYIGG